MAGERIAPYSINVELYNIDSSVKSSKLLEIGSGDKYSDFLMVVANDFEKDINLIERLSKKSHGRRRGLKEVRDIKYSLPNQEDMQAYLDTLYGKNDKRIQLLVDNEGEPLGFNLINIEKESE